MEEHSFGLFAGSGRTIEFPVDKHLKNKSKIELPYIDIMGNGCYHGPIKGNP